MAFGVLDSWDMFRAALCLLAAFRIGASLTINVPPQGYEENIGQFPSDAPFGLGDILFYPTRVHRISGLDLEFVNANSSAKLLAQNQLQYPLNFYVGPPQTWRENVTHFGTLAVSQLYPGIDVKCNLGQLQIEVAPGGDLNQLVIRGSASGRPVDVFDGVLSSVRAYQAVGDANLSRNIRPSYEFSRSSIDVRFVGSYDTSVTLVIEVQTYFVVDRYPKTLTVAPDGTVLLAGYPGFLAKLNSDGTPAFLTSVEGLDGRWIGSRQAGGITMEGLVIAQLDHAGPYPPITSNAPQSAPSLGWLGRFDEIGRLRASTYIDSDPTLYTPPLVLGVMVACISRPDNL